MKTIELNEQEFRKMVLDLHMAKHFRGDPHRMQADFKKHKNSQRFVGIAYEEDEQIVAFCGMDVFKTSAGDIKGMIHCQGVIQSHRRKGLSIKILKEIEGYMGDDVTEILSICNPISCKSHQAVGYEITSPGRTTRTGKISQIRLKKDVVKSLSE